MSVGSEGACVIAKSMRAMRCGMRATVEQERQKVWGGTACTRGREFTGSTAEAGLIILIKARRETGGGCW